MQLVGIQIYSLNIARIKNNTKKRICTLSWSVARIFLDRFFYLSQMKHLPNTHSVSALIRRCDDLPATITHVPVAAVLVSNTPDDGRLRPKHVDWLCKNKTCTVLHQVGVSFDLYYDARKHKIKKSFIYLGRVCNCLFFVINPLQKLEKFPIYFVSLFWITSSDKYSFSHVSQYQAMNHWAA